MNNLLVKLRSLKKLCSPAIILFSLKIARSPTSPSRSLSLKPRNTHPRLRNGRANPSSSIRPNSMPARKSTRSNSRLRSTKILHRREDGLNESLCLKILRELKRSSIFRKQRRPVLTRVFRSEKSAKRYRKNSISSRQLYKSYEPFVSKKRLLLWTGRLQISYCLNSTAANSEEQRFGRPPSLYRGSKVCRSLPAPSARRDSTKDRLRSSKINACELDDEGRRARNTAHQSHAR